MQLTILILFTITTLCAVVAHKYTPTWESIDSRPLPDWYDDSKFGIFMHWGVYSVPAFKSEWMWWYWEGANPDKETVKYVDQNWRPGTSYADFGREFHAELFNPETFKDIVEASGARYFVITSKHHEGFTMWPAKTSWNWNAVDVGPKKDIIGMLKKAFSKSKVHFGLYFSLFEWFHPLYVEDQKGNSSNYVEQVSYPQLLDIVNSYEPEVIWSDGDWGADENYWKSKQFLAWLYNESPVKDKIVVNDRWGKDTAGKHGGFMTFSDHYDPGKLVPRKWENCLTLDKDSWGHRRTMRSEDVRTSHDVIEQIARTISCGGNVLLNVGPDMHGVIPPIFEDRLREIGAFLTPNAEALYGSKPWVFQNDSNNVWYTSRLKADYYPQDRIFNVQEQDNTIIYAWMLSIDRMEFELEKIKTTPKTTVSVLSNGVPLTYRTCKKGHLIVNLKEVPWFKMERTDILILKIQFAATNMHNPLSTLVAEQEYLNSNRMHRSLADSDFKL